MTRILQISDSHIVPEGQKAYGVVDTAAALADTVATINRRLPEIGPVDLVVMTGDLTDFGTEAEYARFRAILSALEVPYRAIPGNHDCRETMRRAFADQDWMPETGPLNWRADLAGFSLLALDSTVAGEPFGLLSPETLDWVRHQLHDLDGHPVILACHHPPFEIGIRPMDVQNLRNADDLAEVLQSHRGPSRLICGHVHRLAMTVFAGIPAMTCPGTSHAVTLDLRADNPNSLTLEPGGFLLHAFSGGFVSGLIPVGAFDGGWPFETAPD